MKCFFCKKEACSHIALVKLEDDVEQVVYLCKAHFYKMCSPDNKKMLEEV